MMKRSLVIVLVFLFLILGLAGCTKSENKTDVTMTIKKGTLTSSGATVVLADKSDKKIIFTQLYAIEVKKGFKWNELEKITYLHSPKFYLLPGESREMKLNWEIKYMKLEKGTYRLRKEISYILENGESKTFNVYTKFFVDSNKK